MPHVATYRTPGVYVQEPASFPPSIPGVQTAVPAFIGYTEKAAVNGKPIPQTPVKINSLADYEAVFGGPFEPLYNINDVTDATAISAGQYDFSVTASDGTVAYFTLTQPHDDGFELYDSLRLFYSNGGGTAYVVSVGTYYSPDGATVNSVTKGALLAGLTAIRDEVGPTMLVIPDAVRLSPTDAKDPMVSADFAEVSAVMLRQAGQTQDRVAILDVYGARYLNAKSSQADIDAAIEAFREAVGDVSLSYGMAYFPFLNTNAAQTSDFSYTNISPGADRETLKNDVLTVQARAIYSGAQLTTVLAYINSISDTETVPDPALQQNLSNALPVMNQILGLMASRANVLPPSGAMAGVYTANDSIRGVWNAPANTSLVSVTGPVVRLNNDQQGDLNVPLDGKAVNALRDFVGRGTVVWGARTLLGNSNDFRYIQVRRTLIYVEQSIKSALNQFVFAANDGGTWVTVTSMISNFLQTLWTQGGLMGATQAEAYSVQCGLGSTMTAQDVLDGYMVVQVVLQMVHPAEFIELTFKQKMGAAS